MARLSASLLGRLLLVAPGAIAGLTVDIENQDSIKEAAALAAKDLMSFYTGEIPGILPEEDYYWWTGGALWGTLLDYRDRTGDTAYDETISQGLLWQTGENDDFAPANWTATLGNDDQSFWALAALLAAETGFTSPPSGDPQWADLAQTVFDEQTARLIDSGNCEGALRWQIFTFNNGYNYVNTGSNAAYFSLGAQLARLQDNQTAADLAAGVYDKLADLGFVGDDFSVYDGARAPACSAVNKLQSSYTSALLLQGAAYMYNFTGDSAWRDRVDGLLDRTIAVFFPDGIAVEPSCESAGTCTQDMRFYKGLLHRYVASAARLAPHAQAKASAALRTSAAAAAAQCTGGDGDGGRMCGFEWAGGKFDRSDAGAQMSVLGALVSVVTAASGGTASGNATGTATSDGAAAGAGSTESAVAEGAGARVGGASAGAVAGTVLLGALMMMVVV